MTIEPGTPRRLTLDEIDSMVSEIARDPNSGADRFRALKMLSQQESATIMLPEPRADGEVVDRLARVMKGAGVRLVQIAYQRAFPTAAKARFAGPVVRYTKITPEQEEVASKVTSLKILNRTFPEAKIHGVPKGFPSGRSLAVKAEWCREQARKLIVEREERARREAHEELKEADGLIRDQSTMQEYDQLKDEESAIKMAGYGQPDPDS